MSRLVESFEGFIQKQNVSEAVAVAPTKKEIKVEKTYEVDLKVAGKLLVAQQLPILKQMLKNGGGKIYVVGITGKTVELAGSKMDALIGTIKVKMGEAEQFLKL
jgi:hypothetical protein